MDEDLRKSRNLISRKKEFKSRLPVLSSVQPETNKSFKKSQRILKKTEDSKIPVYDRNLLKLNFQQPQSFKLSSSFALLPPISNDSTLQSHRKKNRIRKSREYKVKDFFVKSKNLIKITGKELSKFPLTVFQVPGIETLILSPEREACLNFKLPRLPKEIANMVELKTLILDTNELEELPPEINRLHNLETLVLSNNNLTFLPDQFQQLGNLTDLHLANNRFADFPNELCHLPKLKFLDLSDNSLIELENEIWLLADTLTTLLLAYNHLVRLPITFSALHSLQTLWLGDNHLTALPEDFGDLVNLDWGREPFSANIDHNPLVRPPLDICRAGVSSIRKYFEDLAQSKNSSTNQFKKVTSKKKKLK